MQAEHIPDHDDPPARLTIGGYHQLRRGAGRWRINEVTLTGLPTPGPVEWPVAVSSTLVGISFGRAN